MKVPSSIHELVEMLAEDAPTAAHLAKLPEEIVANIKGGWHRMFEAMEIAFQEAADRFSSEIVKVRELLPQTEAYAELGTADAVQKYIDELRLAAHLVPPVETKAAEPETPAPAAETQTANWENEGGAAAAPSN